MSTKTKAIKKSLDKATPNIDEMEKMQRGNKKKMKGINRFMHNEDRTMNWERPKNS